MSRHIRSKAVKYGLNFDQDRGQADDRYVRCWHCGFPCHLDRDLHVPKGSRSGDGIAHPPSAVSEYDESVVTYDGACDGFDCIENYDGLGRNDFRIDSGCPKCGCLYFVNK